LNNFQAEAVTDIVFFSLSAYLSRAANDASRFDQYVEAASLSAAFLRDLLADTTGLVGDVIDLANDHDCLPDSAPRRPSQGSGVYSNGHAMQAWSIAGETISIMSQWRNLCVLKLWTDDTNMLINYIERQRP
jgi:hypothetical protein